MKKIVIVLFILVVIILSNTKQQTIEIPDNAIRFRIIASSNNEDDQETKQEIKEELLPVISNILNNSSTKEQTITNIQDNITNMENIIDKYNINYSINYGLNYFPEKLYKGITYNEGNYESLVITLGDGLGDNWWCVLFPPLCLLEAEEETFDNYTYTFYIKEILDKYM